jgi:hypothetical protein
MAVIAALQGNGSGEGFLVAPVGARTFPAALSLQTDTGTADVTLRASPDAAGLVFSQTSCTVTTAPTQVEVHATAKSLSRGDTAIEVDCGDPLSIPEIRNHFGPRLRHLDDVSLVNVKYASSLVLRLGTAASHNIPITMNPVEGSYSPGEAGSDEGC